MTGAAAHFSRSYREARDRFLGAARACRFETIARIHPDARGPDGGELAIDVAVGGDAAARAVLIVSSGTHGVEGYGGSGIQTAWLHDDDARRAIEGKGVRIVMLHALNPWGFAHDARGDENNVDLNRNFRDFGAPQPSNPGYARLHPLLVPSGWPPSLADQARLWLAVRRVGRRAAQDAISRGQCEHADGLFYGGEAPSWSNAMLRALIHRQSAGCVAAGWVDLHTGLGKRAHGELIFNGRHDANDLARARRWWGDAVTSMYDHSSVSTEVVGANFAALDGSEAKLRAGATLEFGTHSPRVVLDGLRARQWLRNHPDAAPALRRSILAQSRDAFHIDTDVWKSAVYVRARAILMQGVQSLSREAGRLQ